MKKKVTIILLTLCFSCFMVACSSGKISTDENEPTDLTGTWASKDNNGSYQEAVITGDTIEINWITNSGKTKSIYWIGTYAAPVKSVDEYSWTSKRDKEKTDSAILASTDDTKDFTYKSGKISYEVSVMGTTTTTELDQVSKDTAISPEEEPSVTESPTLKATPESTPEVAVTPTAEEQTNIDTSDLYNHISNVGYAKMLTEYDSVFMNELSILSEDKIAKIINDNGTMGELQSVISDTLTRLESSEQILQLYYDEFDKDRNSAPMGTRIMTLLSDAQSALRQYTIAMQHLQDYTNNPKQEYIDHFQKYMDKTNESLNDYKAVLEEEKTKLGLS